MSSECEMKDLMATSLERSHKVSLDQEENKSKAKALAAEALSAEHSVLMLLSVFLSDCTVRGRIARLRKKALATR